MQTKISVIIPVYNAEKYLNTCFECLDSQTFQDFEVIFVNDCSQDNTLSMLENYAKQKQAVKIINNAKNLKSDKNKNIALKQANGDYVVFLDCDDKITTNYLEVLYRSCKQNNSDIAICDSYIEFDDNDETQKTINSLKDSLKGKSYAQNYKQLHGILFKIHRAAWAKIYKKSFLIDNDIAFDEKQGCFGDVLFNFKVLLLADGISFCSEAYYLYRVNNTASLTGQKHSKEFFDRKYKIWNSVFELFKESNAYKEFELEIYQFVYNDLFWLSQGVYFYNTVRKAIKNNIDKTEVKTLLKSDKFLKKIYYTPGCLYWLSKNIKKIVYSSKAKFYSCLVNITKNKSFEQKRDKYNTRKAELCF